MRVQSRINEVEAVALSFTSLDRDGLFESELALKGRLDVKPCNLVTIFFAWNDLNVLKQLWTVTNKKTADLFSLAI